MDAKPVNYRIHIEPDLEKFRFEGRMDLTVDIPADQREIVLDILDVAIWSCHVNGPKGETACVFQVDPVREKLRITLPKRDQDRIVLTIAYQGKINDQMAGFYRSGYKIGDEIRYVGVTQFQESDARRAFPCMDHPSKKASFDISMDIDSGFIALSNEDVQEERGLENGKKRVVFRTTPKMSTYLVFFGVGPFEIRADREDPRVRTATLPGMMEAAAFGMDFGRKALAYSESYYGISYPLSKMDLIAIPDFAFGAMENWGAITFRENLLLHYPGVTSRSGEERICEVIAHEIAHQWFGNLVTPSDWKYLWLNESFATYFGYGVVAHYHPEWEMWEQFLNGMTASALSRDGLQATFAIEIPGGEHVVINSSTAPIIYNKGGSVLQQVKGFVGDDDFQAGLRHYLKRHAYRCADSAHLWEALEEISRKPVTRLMKSWIEQPGHPRVDVSRAGENILLKQKRFTYLPGDFEQTWMIPIAITFFHRDGTKSESSVLMEDRETSVPAGSTVAAYKVNSGQTGFYRVSYTDRSNLEQLGVLIAGRRLSPADRWGVQNDLYCLVKASELSLDDYLDFLGHYRKENAYLPLVSIAANLFEAYLVLAENSRNKIASLACSWYESLLFKIGKEPTTDDRHTTAILREQLLWHGILYGSEEMLRWCRDWFWKLRSGEDVHPDVMRSVMQAGAWSGDAETLEWFFSRLRTSTVEHERMNVLQALGCFREHSLVKAVQRHVLDSVPPRNQFIPVVSMAANPESAPLLWGWYTGNLERIEQFHPLLYERVIAAIIPAAGLGQPEEVVSFFQEYSLKNGQVRDVVQLSLERLEIYRRMRRTNA